MKMAGCTSRYMNCRALKNHAYQPTDVEHLANVITHGLWIGPSIVGLWWMMSLSVSSLQCVSVFIYGLSIFCLFTVSTTFHTLAYLGRFRTLQTCFHIGDRAVIYIFIASSYTPWLALKEFHRWSLLTLLVVWAAALLGIYYQYNYHEQYKWLETLFYIIVGMVPSLIIVEMAGTRQDASNYIKWYLQYVRPLFINPWLMFASSVTGSTDGRTWNSKRCFAGIFCLAGFRTKESSGVLELLIGGAMYGIGVVFFKCDGIIPFAHAIWHSFVFLGATLHFFAVCRHLLVEAPPSMVVTEDT